MKRLYIAILAVCLLAPLAKAQTVAELEQRIARNEKELAAAEAEMKSWEKDVSKVLRAVREKVNAKASELKNSIHKDKTKLEQLKKAKTK